MRILILISLMFIGLGAEAQTYNDLDAALRRLNRSTQRSDAANAVLKGVVAYDSLTPQITVLKNENLTLKERIEALEAQIVLLSEVINPDGYLPTEIIDAGEDPVNAWQEFLDNVSTLNKDEFKLTYTQQELVAVLSTRADLPIWLKDEESDKDGMTNWIYANKLELQNF